MNAKTFTTTIVRDGPWCFIPLAFDPMALERWRALSYTHQREQVEAVEAAKKPETRARRIAGAVRKLLQSAARGRAR